MYLHTPSMHPQLFLLQIDGSNLMHALGNPPPDLP